MLQGGSSTDHLPHALAGPSVYLRAPYRISSLMCPEAPPSFSKVTVFSLVPRFPATKTCSCNSGQDEKGMTAAVLSLHKLFEAGGPAPHPSPLPKDYLNSSLSPNTKWPWYQAHFCHLVVVVLFGGVFFIVLFLIAESKFKMQRKTHHFTFT